MLVIRFKNSGEHQDILGKVKKMRMFTDELEEMLEGCYEDDSMDYRGSSYRRKYDDDDMRVEGRYSYRRGGMR